VLVHGQPAHEEEAAVGDHGFDPRGPQPPLEDRTLVVGGWVGAEGTVSEARQVQQTRRRARPPDTIVT
jgi:hypothetical protein